MLETFTGLRICGGEELVQRLKRSQSDLAEQLQRLADELGLALPPVVVELDRSINEGDFELRNGGWRSRGAIDGPDADQMTAIVTLLRRSASRLLSREWIQKRASEARVEQVDALLSACRELLDANVRLTRLDTIMVALRYPHSVTWIPETGSRQVVAALPGTVAILVERPLALAEQLVEIGRAVTLPDQLRTLSPRGELLVSTLAPRRNDSGTFEAEWLATLVDAVRGAAHVGAVLVVAPELRREIWRRLRPAYPDLLVVTRHELPREVTLQRFLPTMSGL